MLVLENILVAEEKSIWLWYGLWQIRKTGVGELLIVLKNIYRRLGRAWKTSRDRSSVNFGDGIASPKPNA